MPQNCLRSKTHIYNNVPPRGNCAAKNQNLKFISSPSSRNHQNLTFPSNIFASSKNFCLERECKQLLAFIPLIKRKSQCSMSCHVRIFHATHVLLSWDSSFLASLMATCSPRVSSSSVSTGWIPNGSAFPSQESKGGA